MEDIKRLLLDIIEEEFTPKPIPLAKRWSGGTMTLKPGNDSQSKDIPLEVLFRKIIGIRESLRVLEQKINGHDALTTEDKLTLEAYITKCYGSLTTFNILFKEDKDKFVGAGSSGGGKSSEEASENKMTVAEARRRIGLNEYGRGEE